MTDRRTLNRRPPPPRSTWPGRVAGLLIGILASGFGLVWYEHRQVEHQASEQVEPVPAEREKAASLTASSGEPASLVAAQSPQMAFDEAKSVNTVEAWDVFLAKVESGEVQAGPLTEQARSERSKLIAAHNTQPAYDEAKSANTVQAWDSFLAKVDSGEVLRGPLADDAKKRRAKLVAIETTKAAFDQAKKLNTIEAWDEFLAGISSGEYQADPFADQARRERVKLAGGLNPQPAFDQAKSTATIEGWDDYLAKVKSGEIQGGPLTERARRERYTLVVSQLQTELRRVGCDPGPSASDWRESSRRALDAYNTNAGTGFDTNVATTDALKSVQQQSARVCPLTCEHGMKPEGDACVAVTCDAEAGEECEKSAPAAAAPAMQEQTDQQAADPRQQAQPHERHQRHAERPSRGGRGGKKCMIFNKPAAC